MSLKIRSDEKVRGDDSALNHGLRFYLAHTTAIHTHIMWYLARFIDSNSYQKRNVGTHLVHNCCTRVGAHMHAKPVCYS